MRRALVLIGVSRTGGNLPELKSIDSSFHEMREWAKEQGLEDGQIHEVSDLKGTMVHLSDIADLIQSLDDSPTPPDQLLVYFNGHGVHNSYGDLWLLSRAPNQANEAVNQLASVNAAYYRYFRHVVLISDACRVPPEDLQFASVTGGSIFQNKNLEGQSKSVDQFFASTVGTPAVEVDIDNEPCSIYTLQLSEFLRGREPSLLEMMHAPDALPKVIRPYPLKEALYSAVRARLKKNGYNQNVRPDAILNSDPKLWLSTFDHDPTAFSNVVGPTQPTLSVAPTAGQTSDVAQKPSVPDLPTKVADSSESSTADSTTPLSTQFQDRLNSSLSIAANMSFYALEPEPWVAEGYHFETSCGFALEGATAIDVKLGGSGEIHSAYGSLVKLALDQPQLALITFGDENGILLPAIPNHIGVIRFDQNVVVDVAYEPSANYGDGYETQEARWSQFSRNARGIRGVREILASAAQTGNLRLAVLSTSQIAQAIDVATYSSDDVDPMLLVLLGYACAASGKQDYLPQLGDLSLQRLTFLPFDLKLLTETGPYRGRWPMPNVLPPFPMLAQGWPLLESASADLRKELSILRNQLQPSPWTLLSPEGVITCRRYVEKREQIAVAAGAM